MITDSKAPLEAEALFRRARPPLLKWFAAQARALPWRPPHPLALPAAGDVLLGPDKPPRRAPYAVWISEVMLQQTQVATVIPYFERWMALFPDPAALAQAPEEAVLRAWAGLGYYARARNLQKAARALVAQGRYPGSAGGWKALPGIGDYTSGAIASLAFDQRAGILDGNAVRVFSRLLGLAFLPGDNAAAKAGYWDLAARWADDPRPGAVNEALMELGARVCVPASPRCAECPLALFCEAKRQGWQNDLPPVKKREKIEAVPMAAVIVKRGGTILLERRGPGAFLAGHEMFPVFMGGEAEAWREAFAARFPELARDKSLLKNARLAGSARHSIMSKRYEVDVWICEAREAAKAGPGETWTRTAGLEERLTNSLAKKIWRVSSG